MFAPLRLFEDEFELKQQRLAGDKPFWHEVGYGSHERADEHRHELTEKLMANNWRVFCDEHLPRRKLEVDRRKLHNKSAGGLCQCNALERYMGKWLCEPCFEVEWLAQANHRWEYACADCLTARPRAKPKRGDLSWRLCIWCERLVWPHKPWR